MSASPGTDFETRRSKLIARHLSAPAQRPASTARGVHHMVFICSDVERTIRFYQELLGFPLVELAENRDYPGGAHFFFDIGGDNMLAFFDFPGLPLEEARETIGGAHHIAISMVPERFDEVRSRVDEAGVPFFGPDRGLTGTIYLRDPDGVLIELSREPLRVMGGRRLGAEG